MNRYFVNTGDGVEYYDTLAEAETAATKAINGWRNGWDMEWPEEVEAVCYGKVLGQSTPMSVEGGKYISYYIKTLCEEDRPAARPHREKILAIADMLAGLEVDEGPLVCDVRRVLDEAESMIRELVEDSEQ